VACCLRVEAFASSDSPTGRQRAPVRAARAEGVLVVQHRRTVDTARSDSTSPFSLAMLQRRFGRDFLRNGSLCTRVSCRAQGQVDAYAWRLDFNAGA